MEGEEVTYVGCLKGAGNNWTADGWLYFNGLKEGDTGGKDWSVNLDWVESYNIVPDDPPEDQPATITVIYHEGMEPEPDPEN